MSLLRVLLTVLFSVAAALATAAIVWSASRGRVFLFPLIILLGVPFFWLRRRRQP